MLNLYNIKEKMNDYCTSDRMNQITLEYLVPVFPEDFMESTSSFSKITWIKSNIGGRDISNRRT